MTRILILHCIDNCQVLDKHTSLFDCDEERSKSKAHHLVVKLAESCGFLPDSINITGLTDCNKVPVSGGGFADIFQAISRDASCSEVCRIFK
jgi:hypothetical protein